MLVVTPRPARLPVDAPEPAVLRIPVPPSTPTAHEGIATAVLAGAGSLGTLAVLGMGRRSSPLLLVALGLATLGATVGARVLVQRRARRQLRRATARWTARLDSGLDHARAAAARQRVALTRTHPSGALALLAVASGAAGLWERRAGDADAWRVSVGTGTTAACLRLEADTPDASAEVPRALEDLARRAVDDHAVIGGAPVPVDLACGPCAVIGRREAGRGIARHVITELAVTRPPEELRIAVLTDEATAWTWLRWLPHGHDAADGTATSVFTEVADVERALVRGGDVFVVVDLSDESRAREVALARGRWLLLARTDHGLSVSTATTIGLHEGTAVVRDGQGVRQLDTVAVLGDADAEQIARLLCPRRLAIPGGGRPADGTVRLADLLGVDALHHDARAHWTGRRDRLAVPIGRHVTGAPVVLDLSEPALGGHGPHGLLIGATGSGKSELLRSLVTGLAVGAPPEEVALLLVDWKGGAAFDGLARLPHVAGLVTNLEGDAALVDRVCASLRGELERRQQLLRDGHADSVRALRERGDVAPPALVVVVDEFGELLSAHPDVLDVLLQVGRLGRSLGVHLVLASQRLDEGRLRGLEAHLRFRLCLRTFTAAESIAVLGGPEAVSLPSTPGEGWLVVDGERTRMRAAHASALAVSPAPPPPVRPLTLRPTVPVGGPEVGARRAAGANSRSTPRGSDDDADPRNGAVDELHALVAAIVRAGANAAAPVWLPPLRDDVTGLDAVALVDEPLAQRQVAWIPQAHAAVVGAPGAGVSTALSAIVAERCRDADVRVVVLRFGGDGLAVDPRRVVGEAGPRDDPAHAALLLDAAVLAARDEGPWAGVHLMLVVDGLARARDVVDDLDQRLARAAPGVLLAVGAHRWSDLRAGLRDLMADRVELRLADLADSEHPRERSRLLMGAPPGRALLGDGRLAQVVRATAWFGSDKFGSDEEDTLKLRPLPAHVHAPRSGRGIGVRIGDHREVLPPDGHVVVLGDRGSGRSTLLVRIARLAADAGEPVSLIDPRGRLPSSRGVTVVDLAGLADQFAPPSTEIASHPVTPLGRALDAGPSRAGSGRLLVIDDADLIPVSRLAALVDALTAGRVRVVLARPVTGAARAAYDPLMNALRESLATTLVLPGDPSEGPLVAGIRAAPGPPGRAVLVEPGRPPMVLQLYAPDNPVVVPIRGAA